MLHCALQMLSVSQIKVGPQVGKATSSGEQKAWIFSIAQSASVVQESSTTLVGPQVISIVSPVFSSTGAHPINNTKINNPKIIFFILKTSKYINNLTPFKNILVVSTR